MKKILSIIIPVYNRKSVTLAIESVCRIKRPEIELIIIDGKSTDGTVECIKKYKNYIDVFISEKDRGIYDAFNKGVKMSTGEWILILASDDELLCDPVPIIEKYNDNNTDLICGSIIITDGNGKYLISQSDKDLKKLDYICSLKHPATLFKRNVYERYGMYDISMKIAGDRDLFLRLERNGAHFKIIDDVIVLFSLEGVSSKNIIKNAYKEDILISDRYKINKLKTRLFFIDRCLHVYGSKIKTLFGIKHKSEYLDKEHINNELKAINANIQL